MKKTDKRLTKSIILGLITLLIIGGIDLLLRPKVESSKFEAVNMQTWQGKTVADYFVDKLRMSPQEAQSATEIGVSFYVSDAMTLDALISNLHYYGLVGDEEALQYALENSEDNVQGEENAIMIGENSIDRGYYNLGPGMTVWEVADVLLNEPKESKIDYGYMFMPGKPESNDNQTEIHL